MRILQLADLYRPVIGGMERHVETLARELARRGHHVAVATVAQHGAPPRECDGAVQVYRLGGWSQAIAPLHQDAMRRFPPPAPDPGLVKALYAVIQREQPQIIHAHGWILYSALPVIRRRDVKVVVTLHDYGLMCVKKTLMHQGHVCSGAAFAKCLACARAHYGRPKGVALTAALYASRRLLRRVDRFLAVSSAVAEAVTAGKLADPRAISVVPTFIPDAAADEVVGRARPSFLPPDNGYVLFVGVLGAHKGLHVLLEAHQGLEDRPPLMLIGTPYGHAPTTYPPDVWVARNVPHADVMAAWAGSALGVVPSIWADPSPQVVMEGMASGRPIVASAIGGIPDLVQQGMTGLLVPPGDARALREAMRALLADEALRARIGAAGRQRAAMFTASSVADRIETIYHELMERPADQKY